MRYCLAVDIGASSGRHIVGWKEEGELKTQEVYRFPNGVTEKDGHLTWDIQALVEHVKAGIEEALKAFGQIESLSVDTWGVDYVLMRGDEEILPCYAYRDNRTEKVIAQVHGLIPFRDLYRQTGIQFQPFNTLYQLYADKVTGRLTEATDFLMMPEYLMYRLCGVKSHEYTNATTGGMVSAETGEYDRKIIRALGMPELLFRPLQQPGTVIGTYRGIAVTLCATHDTGSAVEGIPMEGNHPYISSGTWSLLGVKTEKPITNAESEAANWSNEGGVGYNRYQKNIMGMWLVNRLREELCPGEDWGTILAEAEESRFEETVDANAPVFLAPKRMKGAFDETLQTAPESRGDYFRCAYRSLAMSYREAIEELERNTGKQYGQLYIVGGGAKNGFLNRLTEEATGKKVIALPIEATALGNLQIQLKTFETGPGFNGKGRKSRTGTGFRETEPGFKKTRRRKTEGRKMSYEEARKRYAGMGIDTESAMETLKKVPISLHCWQGDDVRGFDTDPNKPLTGGIQTTGNYPGRARNPEELMADLDKVMSLIPGTPKMNLHASYAIFAEGEWADRDKLEPKHFQKWVDFCKERGLGCDFNPTFFSHPKCDPLTLSSPNEATRQFWIEHGKACIRISSYLAEELGAPCVMNIWTGDGFKDIPGDRMGPRVRYREAIDEILKEKYDFKKVKPCIESKVFGIGVEAYTVGSAEFALSYAAMNMDKCIPLMDNGHYHPTEVVSDKIPALLAFFPEIALHVTRPIRWDSDHVVLFDDETKEIAREIVRCGGLNGRVNIALDYFDASINRISAWVTGYRNLQKALLYALLQPGAEMKALQDEGAFSKLMVIQEEMKTMPFGEVWDAYCRKCGKPADGEWFPMVEEYEKKELVKRQ